MNLDLSTVATLATPLVILALVNLAKGLGLPTRAAAPLAIVLGVGLALADHYLGAVPAFAAAANGLLTALGAAGLYDVAKIVGDPRRPAEVEPVPILEDEVRRRPPAAG